MNCKYIILGFIIIVITILYYSKEKFNSCSFNAKGKSLSSCIIDCSLNHRECSTNKCAQICNSCQDKDSCEWVSPITCSFSPKGSSTMTCIDECLGDKKILWGGDQCTYHKCKKICDTCQDTKSCKWLDAHEDTECNFIPWGKTEQACTDRCVSDDRDTWGGKACNLTKCSAICKGCNDNHNCSWTKTNFLDTEPILSNTAPAQKIRTISGDNKIIVEWYARESEKYPNTGYILYYFKTFKPFNGIKIIYIDAFKTKNCSYTIENLEMGEYYSVSLIALNKNGKSVRSNIEETYIDSKHHVYN